MTVAGVTRERVQEIRQRAETHREASRVAGTIVAIHWQMIEDLLGYLDDQAKRIVELENTTALLDRKWRESPNQSEIGALRQRIAELELQPVVSEDATTEEYDRGHPAVLGMEMAGVAWAAAHASSADWTEPLGAARVDIDWLKQRLAVLEACVSRLDNAVGILDVRGANAETRLDEIAEWIGEQQHSRYYAGKTAPVGVVRRRFPLAGDAAGDFAESVCEDREAAEIEAALKRGRGFPCAADAMQEVL